MLAALPWLCVTLPEVTIRRCLNPWNGVYKPNSYQPEVTAGIMKIKRSGATLVKFCGHFSLSFTSFSFEVGSIVCSMRVWTGPDQFLLPPLCHPQLAWPFSILVPLAPAILCEVWRQEPRTHTSRSDINNHIRLTCIAFPPLFWCCLELQRSTFTRRHAYMHWAATTGLAWLNVCVYMTKWLVCVYSVMMPIYTRFFCRFFIQDGRQVLDMAEPQRTEQVEKFHWHI